MTAANVDLTAKGTWGRYPWFPNRDEHLVHPDDVKRFQKLLPQEKVFYCEDLMNEFLVLRYDRETFRVYPERFQRIPSPAFAFGTEVGIIAVPGQTGVVRGMEWNWKRKEIIHYLEIAGRTSGKWYYLQDLVPIGA